MTIHDAEAGLSTNDYISTQNDWCTVSIEQCVLSKRFKVPVRVALSKIEQWIGRRIAENEIGRSNVTGFHREFNQSSYS